MKKFALVLGGLLVAASTATAGGTAVDTRFFSLAGDPDMGQWFGGDAFDLEVVGQTANSVQIRMGGMFHGTPSIAVDSATSYYPSYYLQSGGMFLGTVKNGYRITSMSIAGGATGSRTPAQLPSLCQSGAACTPGEATTHLDANIYLDTQNGSVNLPPAVIHDFTGPTQLSQAGQVDVSGDFGLTLSSAFWVTATPAHIGYSHDNDGTSQWTRHSKASATLDQPFLLTIQVAPVPEPATYGMLLGGLALLGVAARRRQR